MNTGSVLAQFTITLSQAASELVSVDWYTSDGTAKAAVDYAANKGTVHFAPGETARIVDILVYGRAVGSEDRSFFVEMLPPVNAILGASIGECIIHVDTTGSTPVTQIIVPAGPQGVPGEPGPVGPPGPKGDTPTAADIADDEFAAKGTAGLTNPDVTTIAETARRVAYVAEAKIATVVLADGDNLLAQSDLTGDVVDFSSVGLYPRIARGSAFISPVWSVEADGRLLVKGAIAGDTLYVCQYDVVSGQAVTGAIVNTVKPLLQPIDIATREALRKGYKEAGYVLRDKPESFRNGGTLTSAFDVLLDDATGKAYSGGGPYPQNVAPLTNPVSVGFTDQSDKYLASKLNSTSGASNVVASDGRTVQNTFDNIYIITGNVNLANPYWGAPTIDTGTAAAAAANLAAIQKMLNSGAKRCELDDKPRYLNNTLIMDTRGQTFMGQGKDDNGLIFYGGNIPVISRANPMDVNAAGKPGMRVEHMRIADRSATRSGAWSINLTNGDSNGVDHIFLDGIPGLGATANYGVALGWSLGSTGSNTSFVCHIKNSRLSFAKGLINTSDSYVELNELWGNSRDFALQLGHGGTGVINNQIVPGSQAGILVSSMFGYMIEILRIIGNYFDGSYQSITTGHGIRATNPSGILNSEILGNTFWNLNGSGLNVGMFDNSRLINNTFKDCASADAANTPDILIGSMSGSKIDNTHTRTLIAPKTGANRVNLSPPLQVTANLSGAMNEVAQSVSTSSTYIASQIANPAFVIDNGRILNRSVDQNAVNGTTQVKSGIAYICVAGVWKPITT